MQVSKTLVSGHHARKRKWMPAAQI